MRSDWAMGPYGAEGRLEAPRDWRDDGRGAGDPYARDARARSRETRGEEWERSYRGEAPIVKVIEVVAQSPHSWEDAARHALAEASRTVRDIRSIWVEDMQAIVARDRIVEFRIVAKISFAIHDDVRGRRGEPRAYG